MMRRRWPWRNRSRTCSRWAAASTRTGGWSSAAATRVELAREFGTPAYVVVEDDLRARARAFLAAFAAHGAETRRALRLQGVSLHGRAASCSPRRASPATSRRAASWRWRCARASTRRGSTCTATPSREDELRQAVQAGVGHVVLDNADEIDRLERIVPPARASACCCASRRASPRTHPKISTGGRLEVRLRAGRRAGGDRARAGHDAFELDGLHLHIGSQILDLEPFRPALEAARAARRLPAPTTSAAASASPTPPDDQPPSIDDYVAEKVAAVHELARRPGRRILDEPGRALVANGA